MYSIGEVSKRTGIPASTLRYYETIGLIPHPPERQNGRPRGMRQYTVEDLRFLDFIHGLKETGMTLHDIAAFTEDGCLLSDGIVDAARDAVLGKRIDILDRHVGHIEQQITHWQTVKRLAQAKRTLYAALRHPTPPE